MISSDFNSLPKINGRIEQVKQGAVGDCWLLSGVNKKYTVTAEEFSVAKNRTFDYDEANGARCYSSSDDDVLAIELAVEKKEKFLPKNVDHEKYGELSYGDANMVFGIFSDKTFGRTSELDGDTFKIKGQDGKLSDLSYGHQYAVVNKQDFLKQKSILMEYLKH